MVTIPCSLTLILIWEAISLDVIYTWLSTTFKPVFDFMTILWSSIPGPVMLIFGLFFGFAVGLAILQRLTS